MNTLTSGPCRRKVDTTTSRLAPHPQENLIVQHDPTPGAPSRRSFLKTSAAAVAALAAAPAVHAAGSDVLKVGLVGCGGRGTGAAGQALNADKNIKLYAVADAFEDRLEQSLNSLKKDPALAARIDVPGDRRFVGFDAYKQVIGCCDVALLCTPPHFRPLHLKAAVDAGKHTFVEKPVAVDAPGVRSVLATCAEAKKKGLSIVSGLQLRYSNAHQETLKRLHDGAAGKVQAIQANDFRGQIWVRKREPGWTDMEWQMRDWYYFTWLSGDFNVEQHVHMLDLCSWIKGEYPVKAIGTGGRQVRTGPEYGHIYDHFAIVYEYADGAKLFASCRQTPGCHNDIGAHVMGTKGTAELSRRRLAITGESAWRFDGEANVPAQAEHDAFFASIRAAKPINNGEYMAKSTLLAILGRMAAYTGQQITWDMALNSKEDLTPPRYAWDVELPVPPVATPGVTRFV
jgi:predicted dehydrogenase